MFSPDVATLPHTHSLRPKRARRTGADDSIKLPRAKRQRSALRRDTFEPLTEASLNEVAGAREGLPAANGDVAQEKVAMNGSALPPKDSTLRVGKKPEKRGERSERGNGGLVLSSNEYYTVTQFPSLPDQIRFHPSLPYSSTISPEHGYALALTHSDALIWPYNSNLSSPSASGLLSFKLPFPPISASDPLPIAAFTAKSASGEPGLIVVTPSRGKITYWETITSASSFVPGHTSSGVQGSVPSMANGETVTDIINAEPAGFILIFSHGRAAHLTVKDQVGRPGIGVQFLRKPSTGAGGIIFGSIRNVFISDRRKGIAAIRAGKSSKGQRDVLILTEDGDLELWDTHLGVGNSMMQDMNIKDDILEGLRHNLPQGVRKDFLRFRILDFCFGLYANPSSEIVRPGEKPPTPIVILVSLTNEATTTYYIIEMTTCEPSAKVKVVHPVKCYTEPIPETSKFKPRLCLPKPGRTVFIIFESAVVIFSLARVEESPSSQLLMERQALPDPYQDCVKFLEDTIYSVLGFALEDQDEANKFPACVISVQGFGNVRITSTTVGDTLEDPDDIKITVKSKIEQAVFFGTIRNNPFDLISTAGQDFSAEEVEEAALEISQEILGSNSKYLPKVTPSLENQMKLRAKALEDLITHVKKQYKALSRTARWKLILGAEQLAAAQSMWRVQEDIQKHQSRDRKESLLQSTLLYINEDRKTKPDFSKGETDRVRHWFVHDPARIEHLIIMMANAFDELEQDDITDPRIIADYFREANDLWTAAFDAALRFREDNASVYSLDDEIFKDGILTTGYKGLPELWTSKKSLLDWSEDLIFKTCKFLEHWWATSKANKPENPSRQTILRLSQQLPEQAELFSRLLLERSTRLQEEDDETDPKRREETSQKFKSVKVERLRAMMQSISKFDNMPGTIDLAEKVGDCGQLVELNLEYIKQLIQQGQENTDLSDTDAAKLDKKIRDIQNRAETYFDTFGDKWAYAHFNNMVSNGELGAILSEAQSEDKKQPFLTRFLRRRKAYGKISWINDVVGERSFRRAANTLEMVAECQETDLWNKKTEICLAKLAGLATIETETNSTHIPPLTAKFDKALSLLEIQDRLYGQVDAATSNAVDAQAKEEIALDIFGKRVTGNKPSASKGLLQKGLQTLLARKALTAEQLVDVLTLMDPVEFEGRDDGDPGILGHEFFLALKVVEAMSDASMQEDMSLLIWRRAMIRDDWVLLNETASKNDAQVKAEMMQSSLFSTLFDCFDEIQSIATEDSVKLYSPIAILDAQVFPDAMQKRFKENERDLICRDLEAEQAKLARFKEDARLEQHFLGLVTTAKQMAFDKADLAGEYAAEISVEEQRNADSPEL